MTLRRNRLQSLRQGVTSALDSLGLADDVAAHDGWLDPVALARALDGDDPVLLRAAVELSESGPQHAALPADGWWLLVAADHVRCVPFRGGELVESAVTGVVVNHSEELCCDSAKCDQHKRVTGLWLELDQAPSRLLLGEGLGDDGAALVAVARELARRLGVEAEGTAQDAAAESPPLGREPLGSPLPAGLLARWSLRREGPLFVLRDHASHGSREVAMREWLMTLGFFGGFGAAWYGCWASWQASNWEHTAIFAAIGGVFTFFTVAMAAIARHSGKYRANSEARMSLLRDRMVVSPWHDRDGAVAVAAGGGRFGGAIPLAELDRIHVVEQGAGYSLRCDTAHGPMEVGVLEDEAQAARWTSVLERWTTMVAHASLVLLMIGCGSTTPVTQPSIATARATAMATAAPMVTASATPAPQPMPVKNPIIADDYAAAAAEGKASGRAVFVEVWAPWCHTCLSMKNFVLPDPAVAALAARVVFSTIDSDRPDNAAFMGRYEVNTWPTLFVIDPQDDAVLGLWQGAASVEELRDFVNDAVDARDAKLAPGGPLALMIEAKRAHAAGSWTVAGEHYRRAAKLAPGSWSRLSEARAGAQYVEYKQGHWNRCATMGAAQVASIEGAAVPADYAWVLLFCASKLGPEDRPLQVQATAAAIAKLKEHTDNPPADASVDDRSDALSIYSGALMRIGDRVGARRATLRQVALLEAAAAKAPGPKEAATFDYARMGAYLELGRGQDAVALLSRRSEQLPDAYEPRARLAQALISLGRLDEALEPLDAAIAKSYGPRRLRYFAMKADLQAKRGDRRAAIEIRQALLKAHQELPEAVRNHPRWKALAIKTGKQLKASGVSPQ